MTGNGSWDYLVGDVREVLATLPSQSVQTIVTSPPYWGLRDYGIPPSIWGVEDWVTTHEHEWGDEVKVERKASNNAGIGETTALINRDPDRRSDSGGAFCQICGAWRGCLGLEPTPEMFIEHLVEVCRHLWRVLRDDGIFWLNIGDCYSSGGRASGGKASVSPEEGNAGWHSPPPGLKHKDLVMMPARVALALQADGWYVRSKIIWNKPNPMPESCTDRPTSSYEEIFELTKSGKPTYWVHRDGMGARVKPNADFRYLDLLKGIEHLERPDEFNTIDKVTCPACDGEGEMKGWFGTTECERCKGKGKVRRWKRINLWSGHDYFYDNEAVRDPQTGGAHARGKGPDGTRTLAEHTPKSSEVRGDEGIADFLHFSAVDVPAGRNLRNVIWTITTQSYKEAHFATFPEKIPETCIKAGTSERGCCPQCGAPWERVVGKPEINTIEPTGPKDKGRDGQRLRTSARMGGGAGWRKREQDALDDWKRSCGADSKGEYHGQAVKDYEGTGAEDPSEVKARILHGMVPRVTKGFQQTCDCPSELEPVPCVVLDPFAGSGTTLQVARDLGRSAIGIDISVDYCVKGDVKNPQTVMPDCQEGPCEKCKHFRESYKKLAIERAQLNTKDILSYNEKG